MKISDKWLVENYGWVKSVKGDLIIDFTGIRPSGVIKKDDDIWLNLCDEETLDLNSLESVGNEIRIWGEGKVILNNLQYVKKITLMKESILIIPSLKEVFDLYIYDSSYLVAENLERVNGIFCLKNEIDFVLLKLKEINNLYMAGGSVLSLPNAKKLNVFNFEGNCVLNCSEEIAVRVREICNLGFNEKDSDAVTWLKGMKDYIEINIFNPGIIKQFNKKYFHENISY